MIIWFFSQCHTTSPLNNIYMYIIIHLLEKGHHSNVPDYIFIILYCSNDLCTFLVIGKCGAAFSPFDQQPSHMHVKLNEFVRARVFGHVNHIYYMIVKLSSQSAGKQGCCNPHVLSTPSSCTAQQAHTNRTRYIRLWNERVAVCWRVFAYMA